MSYMGTTDTRLLWNKSQCGRGQKGTLPLFREHSSGRKNSLISRKMSSDYFERKMEANLNFQKK